MCDKVLQALHVQQNQYWDGKKIVPLPDQGNMNEPGHFSPPYPTLADLGANSARVEKLAAKVRGAVSSVRNGSWRGGGGERRKTGMLCRYTRSG